MRSEDLRYLREKLIDRRKLYRSMKGEVSALYEVLIALIKQLEEAEEDANL